MAGIFVGTAERAARDLASLLASAAELSEWSTEQANLVGENIRDPRLQLTCAAAVLAYGGDPHALPIAKRGEHFVNRQVLERWEDAPDEIVLYPFSLSTYNIADEGVILNPNVLGTHEATGLHIPRLETSRSPHDLIVEALAQAWGCPSDNIRIYHRPGKQAIGHNRGIPEESWETWAIKKPKNNP
jgi:hypothetical protein